jgi:hypothetical protein
MCGSPTAVMRLLHGSSLSARCAVGHRRRGAQRRGSRVSPDVVGAETVQHEKSATQGGIGQESAVPLFPVAGFPVGLTSSSVSPPSSPTPRLETELSPAFGSKQEPPIGREDDAARAIEIVRPVDRVDLG